MIPHVIPAGHRCHDETRPVKHLERKGAKMAVESLIRNGVDLVFGFPGGAVIPLYDEILAHRSEIHHVLVRHEQGAIHAAQAYARVKGRTGVAIGTSGPGASNFLTGIMDARLDSTPVVVIAGQVNTTLIGNDAFQECDMMSMTNPITKHNFQVRDIRDLERIFDQAFHIASTGRPGPVYIDLPRDIQMQTTKSRHNGSLDLPYYVETRPVVHHAVSRAATVIRSAKRPLIIMGHGAIHGRAGSILGRLAEELEIPVATTILAKGGFDEKNTLSVGCLGMHGRRIANYAVSEADVLAVFGCRFSDRITGEPKSFARGKRIIHVDIDPYEIGKNVPAHVEINADAGDAARALFDELRGFTGSWPNWTKKIKNLRRVCAKCIPDPKSDHLLPKQVMTALNKIMDDEDVVVTGVGQHQMFASHYLSRSLPRTFITSGGAGTMGFCLPAALGASLAKPDAKIWALDGDGSLQMTLQELGTLSTSGAKVALVVIDNGFLGMVRQWQELFFEKRYSSVQLTGNPDFLKLADAYGIEARRVTDLNSLDDALKYAKTSEKSVLIHVVVEREANIMPMIPPGGKVTDFAGYCIEKPGCFFSEQELTRATGPGETP